MKFATAAAAAALCLALPTQAFAQDAAPADSTEMALAREIVDNGFPEETRMKMFDQVITQLLAQMRAAMPGMTESPEATALFDRHIARVRETSTQVLGRHIEPIMDSLVVAYADQFTLEELRALHGFIMTPEGHGFLTRMAEVNGHPAFAEANQAYMQEYLAQMPQLMEQLRADIEKLQSE